MKLLKCIVNKFVQFILNVPNDSSSNIIKSDSISYGGVKYWRKITTKTILYYKRFHAQLKFRQAVRYMKFDA